MATRLAPSKLDEIASPEAQQAWIASPPSEVVAASRKFPEPRGDENDHKLDCLFNAPKWPNLRSLLRYYISVFILEPFETEGKWWNAVIHEKGASVRINIWREEVLFIGFRCPRNGGEPLAFGDVLVAADGLEGALQRGVHFPQPFHVEKGQVGKKVRQKRIKFSSASNNEIADLLNSEWLIRATRYLNLDLMRAGMLAFDWPRFHSPKLVNAIFADGFNEARRVADEEQKQ
jgi:hypothetical protein